MSKASFTNPIFMRHSYTEYISSSLLSANLLCRVNSLNKHLPC